MQRDLFDSETNSRGYYFAVVKVSTKDITIKTQKLGSFTVCATSV